MLDPVARQIAAQRFLFVDSLRAIAVLLVVWGHVMLVGINDPGTVHNWVPSVLSPIFGEASIAANVHGKLGLVMALSLGVNPGGLGVALFFLISGFVIVQSVEKVSTWQFLVQRFFRIVPTCMAAVIFVALVTLVFCYLTHTSQPNSMRGIFISGLAMNFYNGDFSTIPVLWTLEVEISFYVFMVVMSVVLPARLAGNGLILCSLFCILFVAICASPLLLSRDPSIVRLLSHWSSIFVHISFMLIGSLIYRVHQSRAWTTGLRNILIAFLIYWLCLNILLSANSHREIGASFADGIAAILLFAVGMLLGLKGHWLKPLRWIGGVSYPLYLLHDPIAWMLLVLFSNVGLGMNASGLLSTVIVVFLSWLMHVTIEMPMQNLGKRLAKEMVRSDRQPLAAPELSSMTCNELPEQRSP